MTPYAHFMQSASDAFRNVKLTGEVVVVCFPRPALGFTDATSNFEADCPAAVKPPRINTPMTAECMVLFNSLSEFQTMQLITPMHCLKFLYFPFGRCTSLGS